MCQMCQRPNIWHIRHTKHQKIPFIRCSKSHNFCHMWTVPLHFAMVRARMLKKKKSFLFILSHPYWLSLFSLFLFLFSFSTTPSLSLAILFSSSSYPTLSHSITSLDPAFSPLSLSNCLLSNEGWVPM